MQKTHANIKKTDKKKHTQKKKKIGAHTDYGMLTFLLTDENPGLQIYLKNKNNNKNNNENNNEMNGNNNAQNLWMNVPFKKGHLIVNIGDQLGRWTNDLFVSTLHRVVISKPNTHRYSIPFFFEPNFDCLVTCLIETENNPCKYKPITHGKHILNKYGATHAGFDQSLKNEL